MLIDMRSLYVMNNNNNNNNSFAEKCDSWQLN